MSNFINFILSSRGSNNEASIIKLLSSQGVNREAYKEVRNDLETQSKFNVNDDDMLSVSDILSLISLLPESSLSTNTDLKKKIIHLIVKFEKRQTALKAHLMTLKTLMGEESCELFKVHALKRCFRERRWDTALFLLKTYGFDLLITSKFSASDLCGFFFRHNNSQEIFHNLKSLFIKYPASRKEIAHMILLFKTDLGYIKSVLDFFKPYFDKENLKDLIRKDLIRLYIAHRFTHVVLFLVKTYGIDLLLTSECTGDDRVEFLSYCIKKNENAIADSLKSQLKEEDFQEFIVEASISKQLRLLKYFGINQFIRFFPKDVNLKSHLKSLFSDCLNLPNVDTDCLNEFFKLNSSLFTPNDALHIAIQKHDIDVISLCLEHGADLTLPDSSGMTPLTRLVNTLRELYRTDCSQLTTQWQKWTMLPQDDESRDLLLFSLLILMYSFESNQKKRSELREQIDKWIAFEILNSDRTLNPEKKQKFLTRSFQSPILLEYLLESYLSDLDECFLKNHFEYPCLPLLTPSALAKLSPPTQCKDKIIPFEGQFYEIEGLLEHGDSYISLAMQFETLQTGVRELLRAIPLSDLCALASTDSKSSEACVSLLNGYLIFCTEAQLRVIIPYLSDSAFIDALKWNTRFFYLRKEKDPIPFQLLCLKAATPSQKLLFLKTPELCNLFSQFKQLKEDLQELELCLETFELRCQSLATTQSEKKKALLYEYLITKSSQLDELARNLQQIMQVWKHLQEALNSRETVPSLLDMFARDEQAKAKELIAKKEHLFKVKETLLAEKNRALVDSPLNQDGIPHAFICPISQETMVDPVVTPSGYIYDRTNIEQWIALSHTDPLSKEPLEKEMLKPNTQLKAAIDAWKKKS